MEIKPAGWWISRNWVGYYRSKPSHGQRPHHPLTKVQHSEEYLYNEKQIQVLDQGIESSRFEFVTKTQQHLMKKS